jgi:hypothetical protein
VGEDAGKLARFHQIREAADALTKGRAKYDRCVCAMKKGNESLVEAESLLEAQYESLLEAQCADGYACIAFPLL